MDVPLYTVFHFPTIPLRLYLLLSPCVYFWNRGRISGRNNLGLDGILSEKSHNHWFVRTFPGLCLVEWSSELLHCTVNSKVFLVTDVNYLFSNSVRDPTISLMKRIVPCVGTYIRSSTLSSKVPLQTGGIVSNNKLRYSDVTPTIPCETLWRSLLNFGFSYTTDSTILEIGTNWTGFCLFSICYALTLFKFKMEVWYTK